MSHYRFSSGRRVISSTALAVLAVAYAIAGCSNAEIHNPDGSAGSSPGGQSSQGGMSGAGGTTQIIGNGGSSSSQGGGSPNTGGSSSTVQNTGGMATGGNAAGGGATGGKSNSGSTATGGGATGGKSNSGGATTVGGATGGKSNSGGAAVGGGATGGKSNSGGATTAGGATGGISNSGGATTAGGKSNSGGAATGGAATGGAATGGAATGGAATGGAPTGGASAVAIGGTHSGQATYYDYNNNGHCSFTSTYNNQDFAALNSSDYGSATWCGACVDVTGPKGSASQVIIVDECPSCAAGDLDFKPATFDKIADHSAGRVQITWHFVPCNVTGPIKYHYKEGSSVGWTSVQIIDSRLPVSKVEYSTDNGNTWKTLTRQTYNFFEVSSGFGGAAMVRVTASTGATLTENLPIPSSDTTFTGTKNF